MDENNNYTPSSGQSYSQPQGYDQNHYQNQYYAEVPPSIKKWNWGAFMFTWIWGIANKSYLCLIALIPIVQIVWVFVCGAKGNEWAWKSGEFRNEEIFLATQKTWNRAGIVSFILTLVGCGLSILFFASIISLVASVYPYY